MAAPLGLLRLQDSAKPGEAAKLATAKFAVDALPANGLAGVSLRVSSEAAPTIATRLRDRAGADSSEWPADLRVQQFPGGAL